MSNLIKKMSILVVALLVTLTLAACGTNTPVTPTCEGDQQLVDGECQDVVVPDETAPVLSGITDVAYTIGDDAPDYAAGITSNDGEDGDLTASISVDSSAVDLTTAGTYEVTITSTDAAGNVATRTYNVVVSERELTVEEKIAMDLASIDFTVVDGKIDLPKFSANGTIFFFSSSNPYVLTNGGFVIPPPVGSGPVDVTLNVTASNSGTLVQDTVSITVNPWGEVAVTSSVLVPFVGTSEEYVVEDKAEVEVHYVNNGTVPYIDIETFINMVDGAIDASMLTYTPVGDDVLELSYDVSWEDFDGTLIEETYVAVIDFTANTLTVDTFDFFESYVAPTESDYGDGLNYVDADYVDSETVTIPLGDYNFDIIIYDNEGELEYLMPFAVTNLLFCHGLYYDAYFNGDTIYGIDTFGLSGMDEEDPLYTDMRVSSLNDQDMQDDLKWALYNYIALAFDFFYGLKEDQNVETYYDIISASAENIITGTDVEIYNYVFDFAYGLDDLHTSHSLEGYYKETPAFPGLSINDLGSRSKSFYEDGIWAMQDIFEAYYGSVDDRPEYEMIDNDKTCVIHLDGFSIDTPDEVKAILDTLDTEVTENVVFDLSYNTGGNVGAVFRIFGYMTEEAFTYHSQNPADGSAVTVYIESDYVAYDFEWYIVSSKVSFSAANLMISMAQENGIATVMGTHSSGGASSIGALILPEGSVLLISTNSVLSTRIGNEVDGYEYLSVEYGIQPEYTLQDPTDFAGMISIIEQDQAAEATE